MLWIRARLLSRLLKIPLWVHITAYKDILCHLARVSGGRRNDEPVWNPWHHNNSLAGSVPTKVILTLTTLDGTTTYTSTTGPATLSVSLTSPSTPDEIQLQFGGATKQDTRWFGYAKLAASDVLTGRLSLPITTVPGQKGKWFAELHGPQLDGDINTASTGTADLTLQQGHISGTITTEKSALSVKVDGQLVVDCATLAAGSASSNGFSMDDGGVMLTPDPSFSTPGCKQFALIAGK